MRSWIFQGNPDDYDIDAYLASRPAEVIWLVTRYADKIAVGDRVYFWRNQGQHNAVAGVIAEGIVTTGPVLRTEDPNGVQFWREQGPRATAPHVRAALRLVKVATLREVIRRDWCTEDPVLRDLPNLRMQAGTNYGLSPEHAARIEMLWTRTGRDWTRDEAVAGLWAYAQTYGQPVSRVPGSPVANVALKIGRAVSGVYAKVMNFRSLDPRAVGKGMSGAGDTDRKVWREFYDDSSSRLRSDAVSQEFARLWGAVSDSAAMPEATATAENVADEAVRLEGLSLEQLLTRYASAATQQLRRPSTRVLSSRVYQRNPLVIAVARLRAAHKCEVPECPHPAFETVEGLDYTEVHHIAPLSEGGEDTIENVACLCPSHHREIHLGRRAASLTEQLRRLRGSGLG
ncbi:MAG: EVE domain-containing protein [Alphaproteobacteria bacterium]|nr:EVE domain-containing protein [Alphaproteobacteria bacterium]